MRVLLVEDEVRLAEALSAVIRKKNITVDAVHNGVDGLDCGLTGIYDVILLDIMLPKLDGIEVLRRLRAQGVSTPVLLLTAKGDVTDRVTGLDSGADDYLPKPFSTDELLARIRALGRRKGEIVAEVGLTFGDIRLSTATMKLCRGDAEIQLTQKECELMEFLLLRPNMICSKESIIEKLWGFDSDAEDNHVEVYISFLRKKLGYIGSTSAIVTVRGAGYHMEAQV